MVYPWIPSTRIRWITKRWIIAALLRFLSYPWCNLYPHRNVRKTWRILKLNRCLMMFIPPKYPNWVAETGDGRMALRYATCQGGFMYVSVPLENTAGVPQVYRIDCQSHVDDWVMTSITNQHGKAK